MSQQMHDDIGKLETSTRHLKQVIKDLRRVLQKYQEHGFWPSGDPDPAVTPLNECRGFLAFAERALSSDRHGSESAIAVIITNRKLLRDNLLLKSPIISNEEGEHPWSDATDFCTTLSQLVSDKSGGVDDAARQLYAEMEAYHEPTRAEPEQAIVQKFVDTALKARTKEEDDDDDEEERSPQEFPHEMPYFPHGSLCERYGKSLETSYECLVEIFDLIDDLGRAMKMFNDVYAGVIMEDPDFQEMGEDEDFDFGGFLAAGFKDSDWE